MALLTMSMPAHSADRMSAEVPPNSSGTEVYHSDKTLADGTRVWTSTTSYELSTGDIAEAYLMIDRNESGEAYFAINGDIVAHVTYAVDRRTRDPIVESWFAPDLGYPPDVIAELLRELPGGEMVYGTIPQEFQCSDFGKRALKAAKYLWIGASYALGAACCLGGGPGCVVCAAGAGIAGAAGADSLDGHCD